MVNINKLDYAKSICNEYFGEILRDIYCEFHDGGEYIMVTLFLNKLISELFYRNNKDCIIDKMDNTYGYGRWMIVILNNDEVVFSFYSELKGI